jgi:uncharacterized protein (TIGR03435 family)
MYPHPVLEVKDPARFDGSCSLDSSNCRFNYVLAVPLKQVTRENIMKYMQQDLERAFGYQAFVDERDMPVWKLVAKPGASEKIKTKGGVSKNISLEESYSLYRGFSLINVPMEDVGLWLFAYMNQTTKHPFIDATSIKGNVDFTIEADMMDIQDVKAALQKQGFDLVLGTKKMKVLVIRDPKSEKDKDEINHSKGF